MAYRFGVLRTDNSAQAEEHNNEWTGSKTLGIEVTRPALAERCGLGNIDPQHVLDGKSSAIEDSMQFPLPDDDTRLVTIRLDKDAVGAMAVLDLRREGKGEKIDKMLVHWVGVLDRMRYHDAREKYPELAAMFTGEITDAMNVIVKDQRTYLPRKVREIGSILCGEMPKGEISRIAALRERNSTHYSVETFGPNIGFTHAPGKYEEARNWGNPRFAVFVVHDPERHTESGGIQDRWTLVRQQGKFDRLQFDADINAAEADARGISVDELRQQSLAWGGNKNIVSSPQGNGFGTALTKGQIIALVQKHADSGIVS